MKLFYCFCFVFSFNIMCSSHFIDDITEREFEPIIITSKLSHFIEFPVPIPKLSKTVVNIKMFKPNGDIIKGKTIHINFKTISKYANEIFQFFKNYFTLIDSDEVNVSIGPLKESDNGNWLVSSEFQDLSGNFVDFFRIITVEIKEIVPTNPSQLYLKLGETYKLGLKENVTNLLSCEIQAPKSTFDRYYERDLTNPEFCNYIIPDVKPQDEGVWKIIAVGNIVFEGHGRLHVLK